MSKKKTLRTLAAAALCCGALISAAAADCVGGAVTTTAVNLRAGAGMHGIQIVNQGFHCLIGYTINFLIRILTGDKLRFFQ